MFANKKYLLVATASCLAATTASAHAQQMFGANNHNGNSVIYEVGDAASGPGIGHVIAANTLTVYDDLFHGSIADIVFAPGQAIAAAVPEPSSWAMMIVGFGAVGRALRRRQAPTGMLARTGAT